VTVHGNQECNALATVLWDNAFAEPGRLPFQVPEKVPWPMLAQALMCKFASHCGLGLSNDNLAYLAFKLLGPADDYSVHFVTWSQFNREPLHGRNFTFWEWFYSILKLTKDWLQGPWKERLIHGFVSKQQAQEWLMRSVNGTFLLRFSDSELGGITIAWVAEDPNKPGERQVWNLAPFTDKHFRIRGLGDTIKDLHNLVFLYPNINKSQCFSKFWTMSQDTNLQPGTSGYIRPDLTTVIPGLMNKPAAPLEDSIIGSPHYDYSVGTPQSCTTDDTAINNLMEDDLMVPDFVTDYNPEDIYQINVNELLQSCNRSLNFP
jgi:signal transducer and activator of transcription 5B